MSKKEVLKKNLQTMRGLWDKGVIYQIVSGPMEKEVAQAMEYTERHIVHAKLYRDPYYRYRFAPNRHAEVPSNGEINRRLRKRYARDSARRDIEAFCRLLLYKDKKVVGSLPIE